jgi:hypothetical protein
MITFLRGLIGGELFHSPETLATMRSDWRRFGFPLDRAALRAPSWPIEYGIGMMRFRMPRLFTPHEVHAAGAGAYGLDGLLALLLS